MTVAVIGAGIQGCAVAIELALARRDVVLFEQRDHVMQAASRWNEGKIHLGYVYANDPSLRTAQRMIEGALVFWDRLGQYLETPLDRSTVSSPFIYGVHRDSLLSPEALVAYVLRVDSLVQEAFATRGRPYLGRNGLPPAVEVAPRGESLEDSLIVRAIRTPERSIDPQYVADAVAGRIAGEPRITTLTDLGVTRIVRRDDGMFRIDADGESHEPFTAVINASWESRLALDATLGYLPPWPWMHRFKLAMHGSSVAVAKAVPSLTLILGPFGDVVNFGRGRIYLSWYPVGHIASHVELQPPVGAGLVDDGRRQRTATETLEALQRLVPGLASPEPGVGDFRVEGGWIFAWGGTEISDLRSGLHQRHAIGVHSDRGYHSIDTGKYGMAPLHAMTVANRVAGEA